MVTVYPIYGSFASNNGSVVGKPAYYLTRLSYYNKFGIDPTTVKTATANSIKVRISDLH